MSLCCNVCESGCTDCELECLFCDGLCEDECCRAE